MSLPEIKAATARLREIREKATPSPIQKTTGYTGLQTYGRRKKEDKNGGFIIAEFYGPSRHDNEAFYLIAANEFLTLLAVIDRLTETLGKYADSNSWCRTSRCNESHWFHQLSKTEEHPTVLAREDLTEAAEMLKKGE